VMRRDHGIDASSSDLISRQLMELEALQAIYPSEFKVIENRTAKYLRTTAVDSGETPMTTMETTTTTTTTTDSPINTLKYCISLRAEKEPQAGTQKHGGEFSATSMKILTLSVCAMALIVLSCIDHFGVHRLNVEIPLRYPLTPPKCRLRCRQATRSSVNKANAQILSEVSKLHGGGGRRGKGGSECVLDLIQYAQDEIVHALVHTSTKHQRQRQTKNDNPMRCNRGRAPHASKEAKGEGKEEMVEVDTVRKEENGTSGSARLIRIDHMNDQKGYQKLLKKWASQLGLRGVLYWKMGERRVEDVFVALVGDHDGEQIKEFSTRLRTQYVDVNLRGIRCRERQSKVIWESTSFVSSTNISTFGVGLSIFEYKEELSMVEGVEALLGKDVNLCQLLQDKCRNSKGKNNRNSRKGRKLKNKKSSGHT